MKILHVLANLAPRYGGPPKACLGMAQAVAALGHRVAVYTTNQDGPGVLTVPTNRPVRQEGVELRFFPIQPPRFWGTSMPLARALKDHLREFDLVHIHSLYLFHDLVTGYFCRRYGIPYVMQPHGALDPFIYRRHRSRKMVMEALFENRNLRRAAAVIFTSDEERRLASPYIFGTPKVVVPLGVNLEEFACLPPSGSFRTRYPEIGDRKMVLFLGRINFKKGLDLLVRAFAPLARERDDVHLVLAGPEDEGWGDRVRHWVGEERIAPRVTFTGMLLGTERLAAFRDADLFVLSSYSENFGIAVVEAMACGLPVVITRPVNIWREIAAAEAGLVIDCDAAQLAAALRRLLADDRLREQMGGKARQLAENTFPWERVADRLAAVYNNLIMGKNRTPGV